MVDGEWVGTAEEWKRAESTLATLDPALSLFSREYKRRLTKNVTRWPGRSFRWKGANDVDCLLQISVENLVSLKLSFWICASRDLCGDRFWKNETIRKEESVQNLLSDLPSLLVEANNKLDDWCMRPQDFVSAAKSSSVPEKL